MGGKARTIFGTVLAFAALVVGAVPVATWIRIGVSGATPFYGAWEARTPRRTK